MSGAVGPVGGRGFGREGPLSVSMEQAVGGAYGWAGPAGIFVGVALGGQSH